MTMWCADCKRGYALDGESPRYYCRGCGGRTEVKQSDHDRDV